MKRERSLEQEETERKALERESKEAGEWPTRNRVAGRKIQRDS